MIREEYNNIENAERYYLQPGYIYANAEKSMISTVLGSCISICLWDSQNFFGGMNHFIYPKSKKNGNNGRYGDVSCQYLIKLMFQLGAKKENLIAHIVGGANNPILKSNIGEKNIEIAEEILNKYKIKVSIRDVGGQVGRKLVFNTETGEILINKGARIREGDWYK